MYPHHHRRRHHCPALQCQLLELKRAACGRLGVQEGDVEIHNYTGCEQGANVRLNATQA